MDLKITDIAELLRVSEKTIRRWINEGKIPAYKLNHQYRFSKIEIEQWMMKQKFLPEKNGYKEDLSSSSENLEPIQVGGSLQFNLYRAINKGEVFPHIHGQTKEEIIQKTAHLIAPHLAAEPQSIAELLLDRERLMPTAFNNGIGVPHTREFVFKNAVDMVFVVYPQHPIEYGALDGEPVHTCFFLFSGEDKKHLQLLAKIAHLGSDSHSLTFLKSKPSKEQLLAYIKDWEENIRKA
ncbi:MAG: PTS sugar transporter subunit IIA [Rhabdochlamydiaceae bacterium]